MHCASCGTQLPSGARNCPNCGAATSEYFSDTGGSLNDATILSSPYDVPSGPSPAPAYGPPGTFPPYNTAPGSSPPSAYPPTTGPNPYDPTRVAPATGYGSNPYNVPPPPPASLYPYSAPPPTPLPPSLPPRRDNKLAILIGTLILLIILVGGAGLFLLLRSTPSGPNSSQSDATATAAAQINATAVAVTQNNNTATVTAQGNATATATANASQNPYSPNTGTLILSDPLHDNSRGYKWDESSADFGSCGFTGGAYHATAPKLGVICVPEAQSLNNLTNFAFEANITVIKGNGCGIAFRLDQVKGTYYGLYISTDGSYALGVGTSSTKYTILKQGSNGAIKKGFNQANLLAVVANGSSIAIYINNQFIDSAQDSTLSKGQIGVASSSLQTAPADAIVSDVRLWAL